MQFLLKHVPFIALAICAGCGTKAEARLAEQAHADSVAAIRADSIARERQDSVNRATPGYVIDSLLPIEEEVRRFKATVGGSAVTSFSGGAPSRDSLFRLFVRAVERRDTATLIRTVISPREFIDLYYPESPHTHPPYRQPPGFLWSQIEINSSKGLTRLLARRGGMPLGAVGLVCDDKPEQQGKNTLWGRCVVRTKSGGVAREERLFGAIVARGGVFKFMSYANSY